MLAVDIRGCSSGRRNVRHGFRPVRMAEGETRANVQCSASAAALRALGSL